MAMEHTDERRGSGAQSSADMRDKAGQAAGAVIGEARDLAEERKAAAADNVVRLSRAVHDAADQLGGELPQAAGYIHSAADRLQSASKTLRERSVEDMVGDFSDFARRQPVAALAGAVLAGFALARFLKSSQSPDHG
jgi:uncharacterized phage infection (PIP) family protein YhgE